MKDFKYLVVNYSNPQDHTDSIKLTYQLRANPVVGKWVNCVLAAQQQYTIDDPGRFYGFGSAEQQQDQALKLINNCIDTINAFEPIVERRLNKVDDQDTLNYLHHIFEVYHGLLDQQTHELWQRAPVQVRQALAELNILVHRCESVYRGAKPRHVVTWYGLPKVNELALEDYQWFEDQVTFGTVYLNYVEIGKTLRDLAFDNDQYIQDDAFKPFTHYSADFNVKFWSDTDRQVEENRSIIKAYYDKHEQFFKQQGWQWSSPQLACGNLPLADLIDTDADAVLAAVEKHQWVKSVLLV